jgi:hypothetical protein
MQLGEIVSVHFRDLGRHGWLTGMGAKRWGRVLVGTG